MAHIMSLIFCLMSIGFMSHVNFKKRPCRPVEFKGQGPLAGRAGVDPEGVGGGGGQDQFHVESKVRR